MAFPTDSFTNLLEEAVLDRLWDRLGAGSTTYPDPDWLQLQSRGRAGGRPIATPAQDDMPALWMEYLAGGDEGRELGRSLPARGEELWNIFVVMELTPEMMDIGRDLPQFREYGSASADLLMRRLIYELSEYDPDVTCPLTNLAFYDKRVTTWSYAGQSVSDFQIIYRIILRYRVQTMI